MESPATLSLTIGYSGTTGVLPHPQVLDCPKYTSYMQAWGCKAETPIHWPTQSGFVHCTVQKAGLS